MALPFAALAVLRYLFLLFELPTLLRRVDFIVEAG
jgi:hypothetical protein